MQSPLIPTFADEAFNLQVAGDQRTISAFEVAQAVLDDTLDLLLEEQVSIPHKMLVTMKKVNSVHGYKVDSVEEAEELLFSKIKLKEHTFSDRVPKPNEIYDGFTRANLANKIISSGNRIAMRTRRGAGNVVFVGSDILDELRRQTVAFVEGEHKADGRWTEVGIFCNTVRVFTGPIPHDEVYVAYVGHRSLIDGPAGLIESNGSWYLVENLCPLNPAANFLYGFRAILD